MTLAAHSKLARASQRSAAADQAAQGWVGDPLKLPFAKVLMDVRTIRVSEAYRRMVQAGAATLTLGQQEETYLDAVRGLDRRDLDVIVEAFAQLVTDMADRPYMDLLGPLYMEIGHKLDKAGGGEFFTPHSVSLLLSRLTFDPSLMRPGEILTANEPAAGTGGMVLAYAQVLHEAGISPLHTRWTVQDLSPRSCWAAFINLTLWGIPATVVCGNTLTLECRWVWENLHWFSAYPWPGKAPREDATSQDFGPLLGGQ